MAEDEPETRDHKYQGLTEHEIQKILDTYDELGNMAKVAEKLSHSKDTVQKYLHQRHPKFSERVTRSADAYDFDAEDFENPDYSSMNHRDFIRWFFSIPGNEADPAFVERLATNAQLRDQIPDEDKMRSILSQSSNDIGNDSDVELISQTYGRVKEKYLSAHGADRQPQAQVQYPPGSWVAPPDQAGGQPQAPPASAGGWEGVDGSSGGQQSPPQTQQQYPNPWMYQQSRSRDDTEMRQMRRRIDRLTAAVEDGLSDEDDEKESPIEMVQEYVQLREAIDKIEGSKDSGSDEAVKAIREELNSLQSQLISETSPEAGEKPDPMNQALQMMAMGNMEADQFKVLMDAMGATDPEVKKAELEYQAAREKREERRDMWSTFFDTLSGVDSDSIETVLKIAENLTTPSEKEEQRPPPQPYYDPYYYDEYEYGYDDPRPPPRQPPRRPPPRQPPRQPPQQPPQQPPRQPEPAQPERPDGPEPDEERPRSPARERIESLDRRVPARPPRADNPKPERPPDPDPAEPPLPGADEVGNRHVRADALPNAEDEPGYTGETAESETNVDPEDDGLDGEWEDVDRADPDDHGDIEPPADFEDDGLDDYQADTEAFEPMGEIEERGESALESAVEDLDEIGEPEPMEVAPDGNGIPEDEEPAYDYDGGHPPDTDALDEPAGATVSVTETQSGDVLDGYDDITVAEGAGEPESWEELDADDLEDRYDTSSYRTFASGCMSDYNDGGVCGKLWAIVKDARGDD